MKALALLALLTACLILPAIGLAQQKRVSLDSVLRACEARTIYLAGGQYYKTGIPCPHGNALRKFRRELERSPAASEEYKRCRRKL